MKRLVWPIFLLTILVVFTILETWAVETGDILTLSAFIWQWADAWRPMIFLSGFLSGALAVHFFWHDATK